MRANKFYISKNGLFITNNGKVGTTSIGAAISGGLRILGGVDNEHVRNLPFMRGNAPSVTRATDTVLMPVREPVARFLSGMQQEALTDIDALLALLNNPESDKLDTYHFRPQHISLQNGQGTRLYKFPEHLEQLAADAELDYPLPKINDGSLKPTPVPVPTDVQRAAILDLYRADADLFTSITEAGQQVGPFDELVIPPTAEEVAALAYKHQHVAQMVKDEAGRVITDRFPMWKQINMSGRAIEILEKIVRGVATAADVEEGDQIKLAFTWVKSVREKSDAIELLANPDWTIDDVKAAYLS